MLWNANRNLDLTQFLLEKEAYMSTINNKGETAFMFETRYGCGNGLIALNKFGYKDIDTKDMNGKTTLVHAAEDEGGGKN